jgi:hypothetical protein
MAREVRRVAKDWQHPTNGKYSDGKTRYKPLFEGYESDAKDFMNRATKDGLQAAVDYCGRAPNKKDYMPDWTEAEATHYQMYETVSEGTPISPVMESPEALARWLADNGADAGAGGVANYSQWLRVCRGGYAPSFVMDSRGITPGVAAFSDEE